MNWDHYFLALAHLVSMKSKDRSTKVGAVIIGPDHEIRSIGYNSFCRGMDDDKLAWHERPLKYEVTEHAERNAIYNAARIGVSLKDCILYTNWGDNPCTDCARGIIQVGIKTIIQPHIPFGGKGALWSEKDQISRDMLRMAGVEIRTIFEITSHSQLKDVYGDGQVNLGFKVEL